MSVTLPIVVSWQSFEPEIDDDDDDDDVSFNKWSGKTLSFTVPI